MNKKIKEFTELSILLALFVGFVYVDRYYLFNTVGSLSFILLSLIVSYYLLKYQSNFYLLTFSVSVIFICFLFLPLDSQFMLPLGIICGYLFSKIVNNNLPKQIKILSLTLVCMVYEILVITLIYPLFNFNFYTFINEISKEMIYLVETLDLSPSSYSFLFENKTLIILSISSVALKSLLEAILIDKLSYRILKKYVLFNRKIDILDYKIPIKYINLMMLLILITFIVYNYNINNNILIVLSSISIAFSLLFVAYGYYFIKEFITKRFKGIWFMLFIVYSTIFFPYSYFMILCVGYLFLTNLIKRGNYETN